MPEPTTTPGIAWSHFMSNTLCNSVGTASDSLIRCIQPGLAVDPMNGREMRRQSARNKKRTDRTAKQAITRKGFASK